MILQLQAIARLVTLLLLAALALVGLAVAVFSVPGGDSGLPRLAELAQLPAVRDEVGAFLERLEAGEASDVAWIAGFGAALVALLVIVGVVGRRRERLLPLASESGAPPADADADGGQEEASPPPGRLAARRRPLAQMAATLAGRVRETESLSLRVHPRRRRPGGRLRIVARFSRDADVEAGRQRIREEVRPVAEPFALKPSVRVRPVREEPR
ncbi:MAG TPA: hypothetical protein VGR12_04565 [Solirubrobacteraceae bacterium]|nr:hypothetical protein [Solirubrobacteraceae bacterium]